MKKFILQSLEAKIGPFAFELFRNESLVGFGQLNRSVFHAPFKVFVQMAKRRFRAFLRGKIAADRSDVHRLSRSRIIDPETVDQKRYRRSGSEMPEMQFALP